MVMKTKPSMWIFLATHLLQQLENSEIGQILLRKKPSCGARNEFFWLQNATKPSPHGLVGAYDPYGVSHSGLGRPSGAWWILLVVLLAALIAITVILIILIAFRRSRNDYYDTTVKTNKDKTYIAAETEPLNGYKKPKKSNRHRIDVPDSRTMKLFAHRHLNRSTEFKKMVIRCHTSSHRVIRLSRPVSPWWWTKAPIIVGNRRESSEDRAMAAIREWPVLSRSTLWTIILRPWPIPKTLYRNVFIVVIRHAIGISLIMHVHGKWLCDLEATLIQKQYIAKCL